MLSSIRSCEKCNREGSRENRTGYQVTNQVGRSVNNVRYTEIYVMYNIVISRKLYLGKSLILEMLSITVVCAVQNPDLRKVIQIFVDVHW